MSTDIDLLTDQVHYYRARAAEYDEWFLRLGRYDRGAAANATWFREVELVRAALEGFGPCGKVLELASGTGLWTERLVPFADELTCVDASPETIEINRARLGGGGGVRYEEADLFSWEPAGQYDTVFFSFWLSHVPPERFDRFWGMVGRALAPGGRVFFVDSRFEPSSAAVDHVHEGPAATTVTRRLNDGREFRVVKVFYDPGELTARLAGLGFAAEVRVTPAYFIYGSARML